MTMTTLRYAAAACLLVGMAAPRAAGAQDADSAIIPDTAAAGYVGKRVTVEGRVANVKVGRHHGTTFLNFRFPYPDHSFSAWIPDSVSGAFPGVERLAGRRVRVTGTVWMQDDKWPAVTLQRREDLVELPDDPQR